MKNYKVNFDFEMLLANPQLSPNTKINSEFEYVFFFINKETCSLNNYYSYSNEYLEYLKSHKIQIPLFKKSSSLDWWGDYSREKVKDLNSKVFSTQLAFADNLLPADFRVVNSQSDVLSLMKTNKDYLLRSDFGFSGKGHLKVNSETNPKAIEKFLSRNGACIFSPYLLRELDIGVTLDLESDSYFIVENFNHPSGSFRGGRFFLNSSELKEQYPFISTEILENAILWNKEKAIEKEAKKTIQIDMFYYHNDGEIKLCPHVEWNYRKTMGLMLKSLKDINKKKFLSWVIIPHKNINREIDSSIYSNINEGVLITSPLEKHMFLSFCVYADTKAQHNETLLRFLDQISLADDFTRANCLIKN